MSCLFELRIFKIFPEHKILKENWREKRDNLREFIIIRAAVLQQHPKVTVNTLNLAALKLFLTQPSLGEVKKPYRDTPNLCMPIYVAASKETLSTQVLFKIRLYLLITDLMLFLKFKKKLWPLW